MQIDYNRKEFVEYLTRVRGRAASTSRAYDFDLKHFISWLTSRDITESDKVTTRLIEDYLQQLTISMATKARVRSSIASFFKFLVNREVVAANPCDRLESIKLIQKEPSYLTPQQISAFMEAVNSTSLFYLLRNQTIMQLLLKSGLRRAEVVSLNIEDFDLHQGTVKVTRKGGKRQTLPLHSELVSDLIAYVESQQRVAGPLFVSKRGNRLSASELWHLVKQYAKIAGLSPEVTVHTLRHSYASALLRQNVPTSYIQSLMGHQHLSTTARYLHFQEGQVRAALEEVRF